MIYNVKKVQAKLEAQNNGHILGVTTYLFIACLSFYTQSSGYFSYKIIGTWCFR